MGCLNSNGQFNHWFANVHFSGPCNRACYFCIGQHMMGLDSFNDLDSWPLPGMSEFVECCNARGVTEINFTGTNTDPLMYQHLDKLCAYLREHIPGVVIGIRTNGARIRPEIWSLFDKGSISITTFDPEIYKRTMGKGSPPDLKKILALPAKINESLKINVVLCPEILGDDLIRTLWHLERLGIKRVNLREPYGQPHIGDPLQALGYIPTGEHLGMPFHNLGRTQVTYWDVHYVEVESVNLYANGNVSETYPITKGYDSDKGEVKGQEKFITSGRVFEQWVNTPKKVRLKVI